MNQSETTSAAGGGEKPPLVESFAINPVGEADIIVDGHCRFVGERDFLAYQAWAKQQIAALAASTAKGGTKVLTQNKWPLGQTPLHGFKIGDEVSIAEGDTAAGAGRISDFDASGSRNYARIEYPDNTFEWVTLSRVFRLGRGPQSADRVTEEEDARAIAAIIATPDVEMAAQLSPEREAILRGEVADAALRFRIREALSDCSTVDFYDISDDGVDNLAMIAAKAASPPPPARAAGGDSGDLGALSAGARQKPDAGIEEIVARYAVTGKKAIEDAIATQRPAGPGAPSRCIHCDAPLTAEEREFYSTGCERCMSKFHAAMVAEDLSLLPSPPTPDLGAQGEPVAWAYDMIMRGIPNGVIATPQVSFTYPNSRIEFISNVRPLYERPPVARDEEADDLNGAPRKAPLVPLDDETAELAASERISAAQAAYDEALQDYDPTEPEHEVRLFDAMKEAITVADALAPTPDLGAQGEPVAWLYEVLPSWRDWAPIVSLSRPEETYRTRNIEPLFKQAPAAPRTGSGVSVEEIKSILRQNLEVREEHGDAWDDAGGPWIDGHDEAARSIHVLFAQAPRDGGETLETIAEWCEQTFGPIQPSRIVSRAAEEMDELRAEPTKVEEAADVVIVLARYPGLWAEIQRKMKINRARKWRLMGDGTGYHIKSTPPSGVETIRQDNTSGGL